jgi:hypothetical protein
MQRLQEIEKAKLNLEKDKNERENKSSEKEEVLPSLQIRKMRADAEEAEIIAKRKLLLTRKKLREEGVVQVDIDILFPFNQ